MDYTTGSGDSGFVLDTSITNQTLSNNVTLGATALPPNKFISMTGHKIIGAVLLAVTIFGVIENTLVIHLLRKEKRLHSMTNSYVIALFASDLLMSIVGVPFACISSFYGEWVFGDQGCVFHGFIVMFLGLTDLYLITAISVDRYIAVVRPDYRVMMTPRSTKFIIFGCVSASFLWSLFPLLGWDSFTYEGLGTSCSINWMSRKPSDIAYVMVLYVIFFCFPLLVIVGAYVRIFIEVSTFQDTYSGLFLYV